jgi:hypothetical protein
MSALTISFIATFLFINFKGLKDLSNFKTFNAGILDPESDISNIEELTINPSS